ncbi:uncharacterized protein C8Q71DRAFT_380524 [Rhodofomes roseus]|uniref:Ammonium transporter AmtB-like domain-containing protein n=1 Tax=Rhodofomes roseus TaxID=34475 RepID=A0ABQ8K0I2_9APHY|nr:uncharacterized protein C8Q71DRAFT_380524 [Rhodofomes roseus]KAH9830157.1 hypothetical protein C8Q71DRAFT_380524 [Rhodofomes roseus]
MVNVTYDSSGDLQWYDPSSGTTYVYNLGDIAWVLASTALVWIMIPGVGFFYSGLLRRKNALSMIWMSMMTLAVVSFQVSVLSLAKPSRLAMRCAASTRPLTSPENRTFCSPHTGAPKARVHCTSRPPPALRRLHTAVNLSRCTHRGPPELPCPARPWSAAGGTARTAVPVCVDTDVILSSPCRHRAVREPAIAQGPPASSPWVARHPSAQRVHLSGLNHPAVLPRMPAGFLRAQVSKRPTLRRCPTPTTHTGVPTVHSFPMWLVGGTHRRGSDIHICFSSAVEASRNLL